MRDTAGLRRVLIQRRDALPPEERGRKSDAIWKRLAELPAFRQAVQVLFYISHGSEVETAMMRRLARGLGQGVCAPRSQPGTRSMHFYLLPEDEPLSSGPYGILQPAGDLPLADLARPSVVIVPGLGFDRLGNRLGFGGGYYDRWLAGEGRGLPTVGLAFHEQLLESIPVREHDMPVQVIVTDTETIQVS